MLFQRWSVTLCVLLTCCRAQGEEKSTPAPEVEWREIEIKVLDPQGEPVAGATVTPWALGSEIGHGLWNKQAFGEPQAVESNDQGVLVVKYPRFHGEQVAVDRVSVTVDHPDYCWSNLHLEAAEKQTVRLDTGVRLKVAVFTEEGKERLRHCHLLIPNEDAPRSKLFQQRDDGLIVTRPLSQESGLIRVVHLPESGPPLFSEPFEWNDETGQRPFVLLTVKPGVKVRGQLDNSVPRPVRRGHVSAVATQSLVDAGGANPGWNQAWWMWEDVADVAPDGTFEFASLPPAADYQMFAVCEGFASALPEADSFAKYKARYADGTDRNSYSAMPQFLTPEGDAAEVTMAMRPTFDVTFHFVDPEGKPIGGIKAGVNPNQYVLGGGSRIFGDWYRSHQTLLIEDWTKWKNEPEFPYHGVADETGTLVIRNLIEDDSSLGLWDDSKWELPIQDGRRSMRVNLKPGISVVEVKLQPQGSETLKSAE